MSLTNTYKLLFIALFMAVTFFRFQLKHRIPLLTCRMCLYLIGPIQGGDYYWSQPEGWVAGSNTVDLF